MLLVHCLENGSTAGDLVEDGVDRGGPPEGLGVVVVDVEVLLDGGDEVGAL